MSSVNINSHFQLIFRHPQVRAGKYGKVICKGVKAVPEKEHYILKRGLERLLDLKPMLLSDVEHEKIDGHPIHGKAIEFYFEPLKVKAPSLDGNNVPDVTEEERFQNLMEKDAAAAWLPEGGEMYRRLLLAQQEIRELKAQLAGVVKSTGIREETAANISLRACYEHFEKHLTCSTPSAKKDVLRSVKQVLEKMSFTKYDDKGKVIKQDVVGMDMPHGSITKRMIEQAVADVKPKTDTMRARHVTFVRRFFHEISLPQKSNNGLGLENVGIALEPKRKDSGNKETLDPAALLASKSLSPYWKAVLAVLGYGGLRNNELAGLEWAHIDEATGIIKIRKTDHHDKLKTDSSERDVPPFKNVWKFIRDYKKVAATKTGLVFPRKVNKKGKVISWFKGDADEQECKGLCSAIKAAIKKAGGDSKEPNRRLRRFWETSMRKAGFGPDQIEAMGGHSNKVGLKHYTKHEDVVAAAAVIIPTL